MLIPNMYNIRVTLIILLVILAMDEASSSLPSYSNIYWGFTTHTPSMYRDGDIENEEMETESGTGRRALVEDGGFISYGALERDNVPCSRPGNSYYNCAAVSGQANPYQRGCSVITQCARIIR
ncbi:hypothetical protein RJ639_028759 [Escallonia herrerae]|uniref:Rapid ALkalinization Factor n=1 Tax=Escallonia herrerae TaxID=1293975 RepID=A0AA88X8K1_9ASTE|nr:hypothetical protein RJ639_028759 [Escallonia herrerae]